MGPPSFLEAVSRRGFLRKASPDKADAAIGAMKVRRPAADPVVKMRFAFLEARCFSRYAGT